MLSCFSASLVTLNAGTFTSANRDTEKEGRAQLRKAYGSVGKWSEGRVLRLVLVFGGSFKGRGNPLQLTEPLEVWVSAQDFSPPRSD